MLESWNVWIAADIYFLYMYLNWADTIIIVNILCLAICLQNYVYNYMLNCSLLFYRRLCIMSRLLIVYDIVNLLLCKISIHSHHRIFYDNSVAGNAIPECCDTCVICS